MTSPPNDDGHGHDELRDDELRMPARELLDAWEVPMASTELTDRIMDRLDELPAPPSVDPSPRAPAAPASPWHGGLGWAVVGVGMVAAAALVLAIVRPWATGSAPVVDEPSSSAVVSHPATTMTAAATLVVRTDPPDARVAIDGIPVAGPSPFSITGLHQGTHRLTVERDGYLPVERTVEGGMAAEVPIELPRRDVVLTLSVDPPDASVRLWEGDQGVEIGSDGDRHALTRRAGASYEIEASAPGYVPRRIPLPLTGEADQAVSLSLVRDRSAAEPSDTRTSSARVQPRKLEAPFAGRSKPEHTVVPELLDPFSKKSQDERPARLNIGTAPGDPPAQVWIDGRRKGTTPLVAVEVDPGRHRVEFRFPDGTTETVRIEVEAGERRVVRNGG